MNKTSSIFIICLIILLFFSCGKGPVNPNNPIINKITYNGNYIGNINVTVSSSATGINTSILNNYLIQVNYGATNNDLIFVNNIIQSTSATLADNKLTIDRHIVNSNTIFYTVEYGTGSFSNNTLTIDFHQDQLTTTNNTVYASGEWTGTLTKQ